MDGQITIVDLGIFFLLAMIVVGMAGKLLNDAAVTDLGPAALMFVVTIVLWVVLTALTLVGVGALLWGGLWAWGEFGPK